MRAGASLPHSLLMGVGRMKRGWGGRLGVPACGLAACRERVWNMGCADPATFNRTKVCLPELMTANPQAKQKLLMAYLDGKDKLGQSNQNLTLRDLEKG